MTSTQGDAVAGAIRQPRENDRGGKREKGRRGAHQKRARTPPNAPRPGVAKLNTSS